MDVNNELLQAIGQMMDDKLSAALAPINKRLDSVDKRLDSVDKRLDSVEESLQVVRTSQLRVELEQIPRISVALDGHTLNSEKLDAIQKNLEDITPTVQALEILHQTGYAK